MEGIGGGIVVAVVGAEVLTGIAAMKSGPMEAEVIVRGMKTETTTLREGPGGTGAQALCIGGEKDEAPALTGGGTIVQLGKVVRRGVLKLSNGTGKEKRQNFVTMPIQKVSTMEVRTMGMVISTMISRVDIDISHMYI